MFEAWLLQVDLRNALAIAKTFYAIHKTYTGFDPAAARLLESSLPWTGNVPANVPGTASIDLAHEDQLIMSMAGDNGHILCVADDITTTETYGWVDGVNATSVAQSGCTADSW